jgi:erythromycin esterase-like protein
MEFHGAGAKELWGTQYHIEMRATDMCDDGTVNVGQIINEEHKPEEVFSVGFGSYKGYCRRECEGELAGDAVPKHSWEYELQTEAKDRSYL